MYLLSIPYSFFPSQSCMSIVLLGSCRPFFGTPTIKRHYTHLCPFSKSKFNLKSDRVNLVAPASLIECLHYLPNVRGIQYKLGLERLTRLGNSNVLRLPVTMRYLFFRTTYNGFNPSFRLHGTLLTVLDGMILILTRSARVKQTQTCFYSFSHNDLNWPLIEYVFPILQGKCI